VRSRVLKTTVLAAVAAAVPQAALRLRRLSLKCWFMGHDDWIRRTPDRLYLECVECGRETQGWATGKRQESLIRPRGRCRQPASDPTTRPLFARVGLFANEVADEARAFRQSPWRRQCRVWRWPRPVVSRQPLEFELVWFVSLIPPAARQHSSSELSQQWWGASLPAEVCDTTKSRAFIYASAPATRSPTCVVL